MVLLLRPTPHGRATWKPICLLPDILGQPRCECANVSHQTAGHDVKTVKNARKTGGRTRSAASRLDRCVAAPLHEHLWLVRQGYWPSPGLGGPRHRLRCRIARMRTSFGV